MAEKQKQIIYVFQELYPVVEGPIKKSGDNLLERFYGFQTVGFPDICESHNKRISDYLLLFLHISMKMHDNNCSLSDYELENLPISGNDPLTSFEGSFKAYSQQGIILRLPLFEHEFINVKKEFREQSRLEIAACSH